MNIQFEIQTLRSKLIAMMRLTQRTLDYSIKATQLGRPELCRVARNNGDEINAIRCWIASHGRELVVADLADAADSRFVCAALRIFNALDVSYVAAIEIAQQTEIRFAAGWTPVSAELIGAGQFVNSLLRLCVVSLLKTEVRHAKAVLENGGAEESLDLAVHFTNHQGNPRTGAQVRFELAVIRCLDKIAGQTREIADSIILWLEEIKQGNYASETAAPRPAHHIARLALGACAVPDLETDSPCKPLGLWSPIPPRQALFSNPSDGCLPSRSLAEAVPSGDFAHDRLLGLQQRVCELLVKNQQLRMALMAERAESHHDQPC